MRIYQEMKDEEAQLRNNNVTTSSTVTVASPIVGTTSVKKEGCNGLFGKGKYKIWVLFAILLLAFWSMFTGSLTLSLNWSAANLTHLSNTSIHEDLDILELEEREKVVKHMWDVYTQSSNIRLPKFWQEAFQAAYLELTGDSQAVRDSAVSEIAKMSLRSISTYESPSNQQSDSRSREGKRIQKQAKDHHKATAIVEGQVIQLR